ncbi:aminotransferase class IV [Janibacter cremeus]|uniref:Branched-chain amino acid aminotransferase n=1 Tax=Janibacter cremeus TaxID=1285192 RepID=A0A852VMP6_9MICO|nr:aminotransferase class IV [Janibacter cremeus]NYF96740.1 branched-chain amino acid aminotransferase [Janibacter cremeus]
MSDVRVWVNGSMVGPDEPSLAALDHGVTVGDGAFETCKIVDGEIFAANRHLARMDRTLAGLGLATADRDLVQQGVDTVLAAGERIGFGRLRYTITGGPGPLGSDRGDRGMTYIVTAAQAAPPASTTAVATVPWTRNERGATAGLKTTSYAENVIALAHAKDKGGTEAIFGNTRGELCEGTGSNIFVVVDGVLRTPLLDSGCLAGITRELAIEWARGAGIEVREEALPMTVLETADEAFLTSTTRDVQPIHAVDGRELRAPGPVTMRVQEAFAKASAASFNP